MGAALTHAFPAIALAIPLRCVLRTLAGVNCPFCGMTRDFVAILTGRAPAINPFSGLTAALLFLLYPCTVLVCLVRSRPFPVSPDRLSWVVPPAMAIMLLLNNR